MEGYCLQKPDLIYQGATKVIPDNRGNVKSRGVLNQPHTFSNWLFAYTVGRNGKAADRDADDAVSLLANSAATYGIQIKDPGFITTDKIHQLKQTLAEDIEKNGVP